MNKAIDKVMYYKNMSPFTGSVWNLHLCFKSGTNM